jgi:hypothetical protein
MPSPIPSIKIAAKAKITRGVKTKPPALEADDGAENVSLSLGVLNLDLRFIAA